MKIEYKLYNPNGNITALVLGEYSEADRKKICSLIFASEKDLEQVGFVTTKDDICYLEMAGGEFCGNASMCSGLLTGKNKIKCSGNNEVLGFSSNGDICSLTCQYLPTGLNHIVFEKAPSIEAEKEIVTQIFPTGYMFLEGNKLTPLVYIPSINTLFWEKSCASGSMAVGSYLYNKYQNDVDMDLNLPGGNINVKVDKNGIVLTERIVFVKNGYIEF